MKSQNTKSTDELKDEVRSELRQVEGDLNNLQGRMTPGQLIDDAIFYKHSRSPGATVEHFKNNPVGTAFLSLGTLMLMEDDSHHSYESSVTRKLSDMKEKVRHQSSQVSNMAGLAKSRISDLKDSVSEFRESFDSKVTELKDELNAKIPNQEDLDVKGKIETMRNKAENLDPLTYMAIGAGLGAMTGAALPVSETERSFVQENLQGKLSTFNEDLQEAINECSNILKDLVLKDVKDMSIKLF